MTDMIGGLRDRTAVVTGSAGAIGQAVARGLAAAGAHVAGVDLDADRAGAFADGLSGTHAGFAADLRRVETFPHLIQDITARLGRPGILMNVAGIIHRNHDLLSVTEEEWDLQHDVNLKASFFLGQAFAAPLIAAGEGGAIVNFSSQGWMSGGYGGSVVYNAAKGGVTTLTRGLARSWAKDGIRVNAVAPGLVDTPMLRQPETTEADLDALRTQVPLGRLGMPEDHVGAAVFLASDAAGYITGATLNVSGGFLMY